jgi:hypothetical protein
MIIGQGKIDNNSKENQGYIIGRIGMEFVDSYLGVAF